MIKFEPTVPVFITLFTLVPLLVLCIFMIIKVRPKEFDSTKLTWGRRLVLVLCLILIALGPCISTKEKRTSLTNLDILFVVDKTGSMSAEDMEGSKTRLEVLKRDIEYLTYTLPPAKFSAIAFDQRASEQVPLTEDSRAIRTWARTLTPEITKYSSGTNLGAPINTIYNVVDDMHTKNPDDKIALIFMSDGENNATNEVPSFDGIKDLIYSGAVIGYGTSTGGKMKEYYPSISGLMNLDRLSDNAGTSHKTTPDENTQSYIKDKSGAEAISKINEDNLRKISKDIGIKYFLRENDESVSNFAYSVFAKNWYEKPVDKNTFVWSLFVWPFEILFAVLLLSEMLMQVLLHSGGRKK
ncbi:MAG: VWA domain-containing protein [Candidatus Ancillula sp.]|jgi:Ca-activated chloride channel family protein|nr:VWA domain-containing protein [Candidatus Ancillula sp.]